MTMTQDRVTQGIIAKDNQSSIKRFVAPTMSRALDLVRQEMGPEAVILSSQKVDGGVEIITSNEPDLATRGVDTRRQFEQNFDAQYDTALPSDSAWKSQAGIEQAVAAYDGRSQPSTFDREPRTDPQKLALEIEKAREKMLAAKRHGQNRQKAADYPIEPTMGGMLSDAACTSDPHKMSPNMSPNMTDSTNLASHSKRPYTPQMNETSTRENRASNHANSVEQEHKLQQLQSEIADMRMLMEQSLWRMSQEESPGLSLPEQIKMPQSLSVVNEHLKRLGIPEALIQELVSDLNPQLRASDAWRECMAKFSKRIPVTSHDMVKQGGIFAFVGQTGVGKTTTIAKLAAQYVLDHGAGRVAIVTTDTYRVGAFDQLKSLGRILNVPVRAVDKNNSLLTVLAGLKQFELILIDTAGFRHGDPILKAQLAQLDTCSSVRRLLVLSCNSQLQTMKASMHAYTSRRGLDACVISKLDEAASLGEALGVVISHNIPVAYTTDGQEIPKDIARATGQGLTVKAVSLMKTHQVGAQSLSRYD